MVMVGATPREWCNSEPLGPFPSVTAAKEAVRQACLEWAEQYDQLECGTHDDYCERYTLITVGETVQPVLKITPSVRLKSSELEEPELPEPPSPAFKVKREKKWPYQITIRSR